MNPDVVTKPDGSYRWPRPASQPLDEEWENRLSSSTLLERSDLIKEAGESLPSWAELELKERLILSRTKVGECYGRVLKKVGTVTTRMASLGAVLG